MKLPAQRIRIRGLNKPLNRIHDLMINGQMAHGKYVREFEDQFAKYCGRKYCVATNSCTSALEISIRAMNIPKGKKIVVPTNTYGATVQACWSAGYAVELVDIEPDLNMDITKIKWSDDIGLILPVFIGGNVPERTQTLCDQAYDRDIPLLADSAHAHGVRDATKYSDISCFSFYATKLITTLGEGGCLVMDNEDWADYARRYRHHGRIRDGMDWEHVQEGANMCMTEAQAIIGLHQLERLDKFIEAREKIARIYNEKFTPVYENGNFYKYIVHGTPKVKSDSITLPSPVYPKPIHQHPMWPVIYKKSAFPVADKHCPGHFCLPIYNDMIRPEAEYVLENVEVVK